MTDSFAYRLYVRSPVLAPLALTVALALLTALVAVHVLVPDVDLTMLRVLRPHDEWGSGQISADYIVEWLRPTHSLALLAAGSIVLSAWRRSWQPILVAASCEALIGFGTLIMKAAVARADPHGDLVHGGSYPSGHTVQVLVTCGVLALLAQHRVATVVSWTAAAVATTLVGFALVVQGTHWTSDVVGGALLGAVVILLARAAMKVLPDATASGGGHA